MSGNKKIIKGNNEVELSGTVFLKKTAEGSKSEHTGVFLKTDTGDFAIRKLGGNPFNDDSLVKLEGKTITAKGILDNNLLMAKEIKTK
jgi:hypothetical protein